MSDIPLTMLSTADSWEACSHFPVIRVTIPGEAQTGGVRFTRGGRRYTPANVAEWRAYVRLLVLEAVEECIPARHPVEVTIIMRKPRPDSYPKKPTASYPCPWAWVTKPDVDNSTKQLFDACKSVAFVDDQQVTDLIVRKRFGERAEVELIIRELSEAELAQVA